ncbi:ribonuclease VapC [Aureimonas endophytica]|uniref:Ribonuclease VapC n=1 Tax=Aureimonas endophytica TaxID=2027858 RepID=A0A916ZGX8_9HYPH|nr:type II toxin-antitoxin system VapC family toxin [Aureimonas endophytica]GGD95274.1 ribonuclease VapC [Aureimonas endophytica]
MIYFLDTNVLSHLMEEPYGHIAQHIAQVPTASVLTSVIVIAELRYGVAWKRSEKLRRRLDVILTRLPVEPWTQPADEIYGDIRAELRRTGNMIGANDLLIAAHALSLDATLVTRNVREFERVRNLKVENWLRD